MNQAFLAVDLPEEALAAPDFGAVFFVVGGLLVRKHVSQGRISAERQPPDFVVDLADGAELARQVNVGLDVDRTQTLGELAGFLRSEEHTSELQSLMRLSSA